MDIFYYIFHPASFSLEAIQMVVGFGCMNLACEIMWQEVDVIHESNVGI